jgi:hypothetical protein
VNPHSPLTEDEKELIRDQATLRLYDPFSVRFRWSRANLVEYKVANRTTHGFETCVWLNSKNLNGSYTGFKPVRIQLFTGRQGKAVVVILPNLDGLSDKFKGKTDNECEEIGMSILESELEPAPDR